MKHKTILQALVESVRRVAAEYNRNTEDAPAAVLWTDESRFWEPLLPELRKALPGLLTYGEWSPDVRQGPAFWLRCALARQLPELGMPDNEPAVLYLPGVSRAQLRQVNICPVPLQPLAELQYRGAYWTQGNSKDWTPFAFLSSKLGGLGLEVAADQPTKEALLRCLNEVFAEPALRYEAARLDAEAVNQLLEIDVNRDLLRWMSAPKEVRATWSSAYWAGFSQQATKKLKFDPAREDALSAAERLAAHEGAWQAVWTRFKEAPANFPGVVDLLERLQPDSLFVDHEPFPTWNAAQESALRSALDGFSQMPSEAEALKQLAALEAEHGIRRNYVWAELGRSPLAISLGHLVQVGSLASQPLSDASPDAMRQQYEKQVWQVDAAMLDSLAAVQDDAATRAVESALSVIYKPWLERHAERFQATVRQHRYPLSLPVPEIPLEAGFAVFFVDGLRYDTGQKLCALLQASGLQALLSSAWTAVPSVTASGKVLVSPAAVCATGTLDDEDFEPSHKVKKQPLKAPLLRKTLEEQGWQVLLNKADVGDPSGSAWVETGELDQYGHANQLRLARDMAYQLSTVRERVQQLLAAGWKRIRIVTDHGWLLVPGKLDKVHIEKDMTETTWGRSAKLKPGAPAQVVTLSWTWCDEVQIAMAPGAKSFKAGEHYSHGGLSLQESLTPVVEVVSKDALLKTASVTSVKWVGLRLKASVSGDGRLFADLRTKASDKETSVVEPQEVTEGKVTLTIEDDGLEGTSATLVVVDEAGRVLAKVPQTIGG